MKMFNNRKKKKLSLFVSALTKFCPLDIQLYWREKLRVRESGKQ
jgi:hypothetical protein